MPEKGFKSLTVWQKAKDLAVAVYQTTNQGELTRDVGLRDQMRRSTISIPSNLAEGDERDSDKESIRFFYIAKGSLAELRTQLQIAYEIGYIKREVYKKFDREYEVLGKMIGALIKSRK